VKPCPGAKRKAQGFTGSPVYSTTSRQEYKGYKKRLQENVLYGSIGKAYVTLLGLSQQAGILELDVMFQ
jgi:hypothetical protein